MSPQWHQNRWGEAKWGYDGLPAPADLRRQLLSANHPWYRALGLATYWRDAAFEVWRVAPDTLADVERLPHIAGGVRTSAWEDAPFQTETLALSFLDPAEYLEGGVYAPLIPLDQLLRLRWQVTGAAGTQPLETGLYRVVTLPTATVDSAGTQEPTVQCEDWLAKPLRDLMLDGANPLGAAVALRDVALAQGCPIVWGVDTYATLIAGLVWTAAGQRLRVPEAWRTLNWWGTSSPVATEPPPPPEPPPAPPGPSAPYATVGVGPNTTNRGTLTHFDVSWDYMLTDTTDFDQILILPDIYDAAGASTVAAGITEPSPYSMLPTGGLRTGGVGADLTLDFGAAGIGAHFWYWHRVRGCLDTPGHVALLG